MGSSEPTRIPAKPPFEFGEARCRSSFLHWRNCLFCCRADSRDSSLSLAQLTRFHNFEVGSKEESERAWSRSTRTFLKLAEASIDSILSMWNRLVAMGMSGVNGSNSLINESVHPRAFRSFRLSI